MRPPVTYLLPGVGSGVASSTTGAGVAAVVGSCVDTVVVVDVTDVVRVEVDVVEGGVGDVESGVVLGALVARSVVTGMGMEY